MAIPREVQEALDEHEVQVASGDEEGVSRATLERAIERAIVMSAIEEHSACMGCGAQGLPSAGSGDECRRLRDLRAQAEALSGEKP